MAIIFIVVSRAPVLSQRDWAFQTGNPVKYTLDKCAHFAMTKQVPRHMYSPGEKHSIEAWLLFLLWSVELLYYHSVTAKLDT